MPSPSKFIRIKWNTTSATDSTGGTDITSACNQVDLERLVNLIDTTVFGTAGMSRIGGLIDATVALGGFYEPSLTGFVSVFETDCAAGTARYIRIFMATAAASTTGSATEPIYGLKVVPDGFRGPKGTPADALTWETTVSMADGVAPVRSTSGTF